MASVCENCGGIPQFSCPAESPSTPPPACSASPGLALLSLAHGRRHPHAKRGPAGAPGTGVRTGRARFACASWTPGRATSCRGPAGRCIHWRASARSARSALGPGTAEPNGDGAIGSGRCGWVPPHGRLGPACCRGRHMKCRPYGRFLVGAAPRPSRSGAFWWGRLRVAAGAPRAREAFGPREAARRRCARPGASWFRRGRRPGRSPGGFRRSRRDGGV